ncbi:tetratricopeptide repeat protein [Paenibacillus chibensis]|uniref:Tetratricopeptide repeat protein n=1 Tax=Paenibacillus chibensis TaxID=59846 RepID=A0ABU6PSF5_9BACL|nr:tetratricopeptide repeat protein [Paenibacillus chibensis]
MKSEQFVRNAYHCILQNDFEGALQWFEAALMENPESAEIHYRCSVTYARSSRLEKALDHAQKACQLDSAKSEFKLNLQHLQSMRLVQDAKKILDSGEIAPASELYQVVAMLKEAVRLDPLYGEAYIWLALSYSGLNEHALAIASLKEAIELQPQDHGLHDMLDQLKNRLSTYLHD